jgi:hypothetical protein
MAEVAVRNGSGQAAKLGTLAEKINAEHQAHLASVQAAMRHIYDSVEPAINAGLLLLEAKELCPHGTFKQWVADNCEVSLRRAQEYMYLARNREELEEAKARGIAPFTNVQDALRFLRDLRPYWREQRHPPPLPHEDLLTVGQARRQKAAEAAEQRLMRKAEFALRTGDYTPPADLATDEVKKWAGALYRATHIREANLDNVLDMLGHQLEILSEHTAPEQVARYLLERRVGSEEDERRADILAELRAGLPWLQRVLEAAEREQAHMQSPE